MSWENYDDVIAQLREIGLLIDGGLVADTAAPQRTRVDEGGKDREKRGWYWLKTAFLLGADGDTLLPHLVGAYGIYHGNDSGKRSVALPRQTRERLTPEQKDALRKQQAEQTRQMAARRRAEVEKAAQRAGKMWRRLALDGHCGYLDEKGVPGYGLRYSPDGAGYLPMLDATGKIFGLQVLLPKGHPKRARLERNKTFWPSGLEKKGHWFLIGSLIGARVALVCEGYATGASLHQASGLPVIVAFDAGNLAPVCEAIRKIYGRLRLLVCADDDYLTPGNPGHTAAAAAALAASGEVVLPRFAQDRAGKKLTDFNDLHALEGLQAVAAQIEARLRELKWDAGSSRGAEHPNQGSGEALKPLLSVDEAVERFALIYGGKGSMFDAQERIIVHKDDVLALCPDHASRVWKLHAERKVVRLNEVGFDPSGKDSRIKCNLWGGWPTRPRQGKCEMLLDLLRYLCGEEDSSGALFAWVIKWLAYPIQHPGAKMQSALVVHGQQGTGKSRFFEAYAQIFGEYGLVLDQGAIEDKFNADWASKRLFVLADEIVARQDMYHVKNRLKTFITGQTIRINPKSVTAYTERNCMNIVFLSNEKQPVVLENDDRRHCIIWTPPKPDEGFFAEVNAEIDAGGVAALHDYLLHADLGDFRPWTKPPMTASKRDLIHLGMDSSERFINDWIGGDTDWPVLPCASMDLYQAYHRWCRGNGVQRPRESNQFLGHVGKLRGWHAGPMHRFENAYYGGDTKRTRMIVPAQEALEANGNAQPPGKTKAQWLTDCFFAFAAALESGQ